jgi:hypothetical protein
MKKKRAVDDVLAQVDTTAAAMVNKNAEVFGTVLLTAGYFGEEHGTKDLLDSQRGMV